MYLKVDSKGKLDRYPYSATDLILASPNTSWPSRPLTDEELAEHGVYPVVATPAPDFDKANQFVIEASPALIDKVWTQQWSIINLVPSERVARAPSADMVPDERDRRVNSGMTFNGIRFQTRDGDRENISGASILALSAIVAGAQPGDYRWHGGAEDFVWIAEDNSQVPMDAHTVLAFGAAAANQKATLIYRCRAIKDMVPIPLDYDSDAYWT